MRFPENVRVFHTLWKNFEFLLADGKKFGVSGRLGVLNSFITTDKPSNCARMNTDALIETV